MINKPRIAYRNNHYTSYIFQSPISDEKPDIYTKILDASFFEYEFKPNEKKKIIGARLLNLSMDPKIVTMSVLFGGTAERKKKELAKFHEIASVDRGEKKCGALEFNRWVLNCYVVKEDIHPSDIDGYTQDDITFYAPDPMWVKEDWKHFQGVTESRTFSETGDFPFDFPFDFVGKQKGVDEINNPYSEDVDMLISIGGNVENPTITIGENVYKVRTTLTMGELLKIDTEKKTIVKVLERGQQVNEFNKRSLEHDTFAKLPPGNHAVTWNGDFDFNVIIYHKRSMPTWD